MFWGGRASRVLAVVSRHRELFCEGVARPMAQHRKDCCGETPQPTRETRVLPR